MDLVNIFLIAVALGMDALSVAVAAGAYFGKASSRQKFRLSFHFGLFQFLMPIIGWLGGFTIEKYISNFDHWIVLGILTWVGIEMIKKSRETEDEDVKKDITKGKKLILLSVATSLDAMAIGFSLALIKADIFFPSIIIGLVCAAMTLLGIYMGEKASNKLGQKAFLVGGILLILIGLKVVLEHTNIF